MHAHIPYNHPLSPLNHFINSNIGVEYLYHRSMHIPYNHPLSPLNHFINSNIGVEYLYHRSMHIPYKYLLSPLTHFINSNSHIGGDSSSSGRGGGKGDKKERVDSSYVTFLLDLLGAIAAGARRVVLDAEAEREGSAASELAQDVKQALRQKLDGLRPGWLAPILQSTASSSSSTALPDDDEDDHDDDDDDDGDGSLYWSSPLPSTGKKKPLGGHTNGTGKGGRRGKKLPMATALSICCEVTALTLDAIYERPMSSLGSGVVRKDKDRERDREKDREREEGDDDENNHHHSASDDPLTTTTSSSSSSAFFVPSALAVLRQCGGQEALLHAFPLALVENNVLATDQEALLVLDYLQSHLTQAISHSHSHTTTSSSSASVNNTSANAGVNNAGVTTNGTLTSAQHTLSMVGGTERDAVELTLALWHRDAVGDARNEVANVVLDCMSHLTTATTSQHHTLIDTTTSSSSSSGSGRVNGSTGPTPLSMSIVTSPLAFRATRPLFPSSSSSSSSLLGQGVFMKTTAGGNNRACFSYEWLTYCYRTMLTKRCLETDFEKIVHAILYLFSGLSYRNCLTIHYYYFSHILSTPSPIYCPRRPLTLSYTSLLSLIFLSSLSFLSYSFFTCFSASSLFFSEPQPAVRARVVKTLSSLTKTDPTLILRDSFRDAVTERFNDVAIRYIPIRYQHNYDQFTLLVHLVYSHHIPSSPSSLFFFIFNDITTTPPSLLSVSERKRSSWWVALC